MSRTYRRKNEQWEYYWVTRDWKRDYTCKYGWFYVDYGLDGKERKEAINKFHSDNANVQSSPPSGFVNVNFTKKDRARQRRELKRILQRAGDYEEYTFRPYKHGAMWEWW